MSIRFFLIGWMFLSFQLYAQDENTKTQVQILDEHGISLISTDFDFKGEQFQQLLSFDFSIYRNEHRSVCVRILNGPHIELYSNHRLLHGDTPNVNDGEFVRVESKTPHHEHHVIPNLKQRKAYLAEAINVFKTDE